MIQFVKGQKTIEVVKKTIEFYASFTRYMMVVLFVGLFSSCTINNLKEESSDAKLNYDSFNYVLATEDASTPDITRFFSFTLSEIDNKRNYDLIKDNSIFTNSDPSTSSGHVFYKDYIFSMAKDKKGYSSTPGLYKLKLNSSNRLYIDKEISINKDNLFPSRKLCVVDQNTGFFYNEGIAPQTIQRFNPTSMQLEGKIDLKPFIQKFRPEAKWVDESGNNLVRTGSLVLDHKQGKLFISVVFLEKASFNLISEKENSFYLAVVDIATMRFEKFIAYDKAKTVSFFVSENQSTTKDQQGNLYFASWGWNQFYSHFPSQVFRIKESETDFDKEFIVDIEKHFGTQHIVQSILSYNNKLYLHISQGVYRFDSSEDSATKFSLQMGYYEVDPKSPDQFKKLDIPLSNPSSRMNVFTVVDDKLFVCVPNSDPLKFNGVYSVDRNGQVKKVLQIANKYKPTRFYKLDPYGQ
ncbi:hypothetical protein GJV76_10860 [Myroides sp. BIT-d1]|uniref:DUF4221 domain-containing protein n=1 Tax=Myroides albus TaxID=2562892 RepID=A0A6I3LMS6_9FLAO|nr:hypothetical protein [Myroides albus]MTG98620.1 hypothetical protein [Myroides albus]